MSSIPKQGTHRNDGLDRSIGVKRLQRQKVAEDRLKGTSTVTATSPVLRCQLASTFFDVTHQLLARFGCERRCERPSRTSETRWRKAVCRLVGFRSTNKGYDVFLRDIIEPLEYIGLKDPVATRQEASLRSNWGQRSVGELGRDQVPKR